MTSLSKKSPEEAPKSISWWIRNNPTRQINEDTTIILQAMRGEDIAYDIGPYAIEFESQDDRDTFYVNAIGDLVRHLHENHPGVDFYPITLRDAGEDDTDDA